MQRVDAGLALEKLRRKMRKTAVAGRCNGELARIGLAISHHFSERTHSESRSRDKNLRHEGNQADRREILQRIVGKIGRNLRRDGHRTHKPQQKRIAVGC